MTVACVRGRVWGSVCLLVGCIRGVHPCLACQESLKRSGGSESREWVGRCEFSHGDRGRGIRHRATSQEGLVRVGRHVWARACVSTGCAREGLKEMLSHEACAWVVCVGVYVCACVCPCQTGVKDGYPSMGLYQELVGEWE